MTNDTALDKLKSGGLDALAESADERPAAEEIVTGEDGRPVGQEVSQQNLRFPQLLLTQGQSGLVTDGLAQPGELWDSLMREKLWPIPGKHLLEEKPEGKLANWLVGERDDMFLVPLIIIPTVNYEDRVMYGEDTVLCRSQRGGLRAAPGFQSPAGPGMSDPTDCEECPMSDWTGAGADRTPPKCSERMNIFCSLPMMQDAPKIVVPFVRTSMPAGQTIATKTEMEGLNPWHLMWGVHCTLEKYSQGSCYVFRVKKLGYTPPEIRAAIGEEAKALREVLRAEEVHADIQAPAAGEGEAGDEVAPEPEVTDADYEEEDEDEDPFGDQ